MITVDAGAFVRAALSEVGHIGLLPFIGTYRGGFPGFAWSEMDRDPTRDEVAAVHRAFCLWYEAFDPFMPHGATWDGHRPGVVDEWCALIREERTS